jgi:tRNA threonylcarbamoyl adenosine modification protein YeaZ
VEKTPKNSGKFKVLGEISWQSKNNEAEKLMPAIYKLLKKCKMDFEDITEVFCVKGPGSFTGLRIGVTVANTISYLTRAELFGMDYFEYLWLVGPDNAKRPALLIFAGKGGVYASLSPKDNPEKDVKNINIADLAKYLKSKKIKNVFGDITMEQKKFLGQAKFVPNRKSFGKVMAEIFATNHKLKSVKIIKPVYIKSPGITPEKSRLFGQKA